MLASILKALAACALPLALAPNGADARQSGEEAHAEPSTREGEAQELETRAAAWRAQGEAALARGELLEAAAALHEAGQIDFGLGELLRCQRTYETVLELARELEHPLLLSLAFAHLGAVHETFGEPVQAREELSEARYWLEQVPGGEAQVDLFIRSHMGAVELREGDLAAARTSFSSALEIARALASPQIEVTLCEQMGALRWREGDPDDALRWHARAVELARGLGQPDALARALVATARVHEMRSEYAAARELLDEARVSARTAQTRREALGQLGNVELRTGRAGTALELYGEVLADARRNGHRGAERDALVAMGQAAHRLGDLELASARLEEALALIGAGELPGQRAEALRTLSFVVQEEGDLVRPIVLLEEANELAHRTGDRLLQAEVLSARVALLYHRGEYAEAEPIARDLLAIGREHGLPDIEATGLRDLAELELRQGRLAPARELSDRAVALFRALDDPRDLQSALLTAVEIAQREGDVAAMTAIVREAEGCFSRGSNLDPERAALQREREVFALWGEHSQDLVALACAAARSPEERQQAIDAGFLRAGAWKGRSLWQGIAEHRRGARTAETIALRRQRGDAAAARDDALLALRDALREEAGEERLSGLRAHLDELDRSLVGIEQRLRSASPADAALDAPEGVGADALARLLGQGRVLIELVDGRHLLYAYTLKDGRLDFRTVGARDDVDERVAGFLAGMTRNDALAGPAEVARRGKELHALLCEPLLDDVAEDAGLVVVPSASLAALPFEALVIDAPTSPTRFDELVFVLDRREVCYAASTPVLALLADARAPRPSRAALVLGDPLCADAAGDALGLPRLIATREEALAVAAQLEAVATAADPGRTHSELTERLGERRSFSFEGRAVELHLGAAATPERLEGDLRRYSVLHCASHGLLDPDDPRRSGLVLSPDAGGHALLHLAGILDLDLDLDLAVLSACDTARGAIQRSEGVRSLASAFQHAGTRAVVASLWPVEDFAAAEVMVAFHRSYGDGATASRALREARLAVRRGDAIGGSLRGRPVIAPTPAASRSGHPYTWAPFVLSGPP